MKVRSLNKRIHNDPQQRTLMNQIDIPVEMEKIFNLYSISLRLLILARRKLGIEGIKLITKLIESKEIHYLDLKDNQLCVDSSFYLLKLFSHSKKLEIAYLSHILSDSNRSLSDEGTLNILEGLKLCKNIKLINLSIMI